MFDYKNVFARSLSEIKRYKHYEHDIHLMHNRRIFRCGWNDVLPFDNLPVELASRYHLIPTHFLNSAIMEGRDSMHLFPVSPSSISLGPCH